MELNKRVAGMDSAHVVFGSIFAVANRLQRVLDAVMPELTAKQFWLLAVLSLFEEPPTLTELAEASGTSHQNVRQLLGKLQTKGFVRLTPDGKDARATRIEATDKAHEWGMATNAQARDFMADMFSGISLADLDVLARSLLSIHSALERLGQSAASGTAAAQ
jgi:DNA-binding MarR family transcriptional regulator